MFLRIFKGDFIIHKIICIFIGILAFLNLVNAESNKVAKPSFDCTKAKSEVEKMICSDESGELQRLDRDMDEAFNIIMGKYDLAFMKEEVKERIKPYLNLLKTSQAEWLKRRNQCKEKENDEKFKSCLKESYIRRIQSFFLEYDAKEGLHINTTTEISPNEYFSCEDVFTRKIWPNGPRAINANNPAPLYGVDEIYGKDERFYKQVLSSMKYLVHPFSYLEDNKDSLVRHSYSKGRPTFGLDKNPIVPITGIKDKNFYYSFEPYNISFCVNLSGDETKELFMDSYSPYCIKLQFGIWVKLEKKDTFYFYSGHPKTYKKLIKKLGPENQENRNQWERESVREAILNGEDYAGPYIPAAEISLDTEIFASKDQEVITMFWNVDDFSGDLVADPFFMRIFRGGDYGKLVCRLPLRQNFIDIHDEKLIKAYFKQFERK